MSVSQSSNNVDETSTVLDLQTYALALHTHGFNVLPIQNHSKAASIKWEAFAKRLQTAKEVADLKWNQNIAVINGPNGIRTIDLDGCNDGEVLLSILELLGLDYEYPWITYSPGRGGGFHIHLKCDDNLTLTSNGIIVGNPRTEGIFQQLELRWHDHYTLLPPSIHPDHTAYQWAYGEPKTSIETVSVQLIEKMFLALATPQKEKAHKEVKDTTTTNTQAALVQGKGIKHDAWAQKALMQELEILQNAPSGNRNTQLNKSSFNLGQIISAKLLDEEEVKTVLSRTAGLIGLSEGEIHATIKSGLESGKKKPRLPKQVFKSNEPPLKLPTLSNINEEKLAAFSADDQGNAEAVYYLYGQYIAYNEAYGWLVWNGTHFTPSQQRISTLIVETLRLRMKAAAHLERTELAAVSKAMAGRVAACRSLLENIAYIDVAEFDNEPDLINVANGIIDLRTRTLFPHAPEYRFSWCSPIHYFPTADRTPWLTFLQETVGSQEMVEYLQKALGYSITGYTTEECLFYIYGPPRSGKGTMSEIILSIFPRPIAIEVDFNTFTAKREGDSQNFDLAPLKAARIVFASESNKYQSLNPAKIKALTGGNLVYCSFKHKDMFNYRPMYVVWLSSNHEVNGDPDDDALWGRTKVIPFPYSRLGSEDKTLKIRLQAPEILEGVLSHLVDGASLWYQDQGRGLITPETVTNLTQQQRSNQDSVGLWLEECCELKADEWIEHTKVMLSYTNWCEANGYEPKKAKGFSQSLAAHGIEVGIRKHIYSPSGTRTKTTGILGLQLA